MKALPLFIGALLLAPQLDAASIVGSRHDLSRYAGPNVCETCHMPQHPSAVPPPPRWAGIETMRLFPLYGSLPMETAVPQPGVASRVCLSCHDGVNAPSNVGGLSVRPSDDLGSATIAEGYDATANRNCAGCTRSDGSAGGLTRGLDPDVGSNHRISIRYPLSPQAPDLIVPPDTVNGWGGGSPYGVRLYGGGVECGSCHNVHDPGADGHFLRTSMAGSRLCLTCHNK